MTLRYDQVSYSYPGTSTGVFDIALEIGRGELLAIIGASGSGKSTILKLLAGFLKPDTGRILIDGKDVGASLPEARRLGVVFQNYALFPHMRLWENIAYPLKVRGIAKQERRARAIEMLGRVGMGKRAEDYPAELSGGQQQRIALARALVFEPQGLLLDEPLSALDAGLRLEMRDEILRVQRQAGIATLLVTHDQEEALSIADKVVMMRDGRIVQIGTPRELYETPADASVAAFVGQSNLWSGSVSGEGMVTTPIGALACDTRGKSIGTKITVFVRPERVEPVTGPVDASNPCCFAGSMSADRYLGPVRRIDMAVAGGAIRLETHLRGPITGVTIPHDAIRLLPPTS